MEPFPVHSNAAVATATTAPEKTQVKKWPAAFVVKKAGEDVPVASETHLAPVAPPAAKNGNLTPLHPAPAVAKVLQPVAPPLAKTIELTPLHSTPVAVKAAPAASCFGGRRQQIALQSEPFGCGGCQDSRTEATGCHSQTGGGKRLSSSEIAVPSDGSPAADQEFLEYRQTLEARRANAGAG